MKMANLRDLDVYIFSDLFSLSSSSHQVCRHQLSGNYRRLSKIRIVESVLAVRWVSISFESLQVARGTFQRSICLNYF